MTAEILFASLHIATPELILAVGALALLMIGVFSGDKSTTTVTGLAVALLLVVGLWIIFAPASGVAFGGVYIADAFGNFMKVLALIGSITAMILAVGQGRFEPIGRFEYPVLLVLATLGILLMISANNLISLYMALELQSLALYVVCAINRESLRSTEAGLKYFVLGALSSGMLLYGMSLVYGFTGNTGFTEIAQVLASETRSLGLVFGLVFVLAGLAFKISAVPFHMWTPDVYEGAPTPVTAFFASAPKVAAMAMALRVAVEAMGPAVLEWRQIVIFAALASIILGAVGAIGQRNIKRLLAYSSINNVGFALIGLAAGSAQGVAGVLFYLAVYIVMTLGSFLIVLQMRDENGQPVETVASLAGLSRTRPALAFALMIFMFSLAGIPPLFGFWAKYAVFEAAVQAGLLSLAVIGIAASTIGAFYYLRVVKTMYFDEPAPAFGREPALVEGGLTLAAAIVISPVSLFLIAPLSAWSLAAARALF